MVWQGKPARLDKKTHHTVHFLWDGLLITNYWAKKKKKQRECLITGGMNVRNRNSCSFSLLFIIVYLISHPYKRPKSWKDYFSWENTSRTCYFFLLLLFSAIYSTKTIIFQDFIRRKIGRKMGIPQGEKLRRKRVNCLVWSRALHGQLLWMLQR